MANKIKKKDVTKCYQKSYLYVKIPENKDPKKYTTEERRAEILVDMIEGGGRHSVTLRGLGKKYGVSHPAIHRDMIELSKDLIDKAPETLELDVYTFLQGNMRKLAKAGKPEKALLFFKEFISWMFNTGKIDKAPEKLEHTIKDVITIDDLREGLGPLKDKLRNKDRNKKGKL